jgi:RimJ/RimL family protein N-acetyltransferase
MTSHPPIPTLSTSRLILRPWRAEDLPAFAALNADPRVAEFLPKCLERAESDALAERIAAHFRQQGCGLWAVEAPGVAPFIGFAGLAAPTFEARFTPCLEIGWRLAFAHWGRGYATEAARRVLAHAFGPLGRAPRSCRSPPATTAARARSWSDSPCDTIPPTSSSIPPCPRTIRSGRTCCTASTGVPSWRRRRASAATLNLVERLGRGAPLTPDDVGDMDRLHRRTRRPMRGFVERRSPPGRRDRR